MATTQEDRPPLAHPDFRVLCASTIFAGIGFRGQLVVLGWLLLESSDSAFIVGLGIGVLMAPNALFGVLGGAIADRIDRRLMLRFLAFGSGINAAVLGVIVLGDAEIWLILLLTFSSGSVWSVQQTARQSYAYDLVGAGRAIGGIALTNLAQRTGGVAGGLGGGAMVAQWGPGEAYLGLSLAFLIAGLLMFLAQSSGQAAPSERNPVLRNLREYFSEIKINPTLTVLLALIAAVEVFGFSHLSALPILVRDELGRGGGTLGVIAAFSAVGGMISIALLSIRGDLKQKGVAFLAVLGLFGVAVMLLGASQTLLLAIVTVTIVSGLAALSDVLSQSLVQAAVRNEMRGRAMGSWTLAIGIAPIGHLQIGALSAAVGVSLALLLNGAALLLLAIGASLAVKTLRRL